MWDKCGMARNTEGLKEAIKEIKELKEEFWRDRENSRRNK